MLFSRKKWGARAATKKHPALHPAKLRGVVLHWPAMTSKITTVEGAKAALRSWQKYHMDGQGWSDLAYGVAVDQLGNRYTGRGLLRVSGANGSTDANEQYASILLMLAPGEDPSWAMVKTVRKLTKKVEKASSRSDTKILGHVDVRPEPTSCPGPATLRGIALHTFRM